MTIDRWTRACEIWMLMKKGKSQAKGGRGNGHRSLLVNGLWNDPPADLTHFCDGRPAEKNIPERRATSIGHSRG